MGRPIGTCSSVKDDGLSGGVICYARARQRKRTGDLLVERALTWPINLRHIYRINTWILLCVVLAVIVFFVLPITRSMRKFDEWGKEQLTNERGEISALS